jgi:cytochrome-b5 reductase
MYQLIQAIDANPQDKTKVTLLFSNVTEKDILLKEAFDDIVSRKPEQFKVQHVIEKPGKGWKGLSGFVGHDELAQNLPLPGLAEKVKIFVCGESREIGLAESSCKKKGNWELIHVDHRPAANGGGYQRRQDITKGPRT